MSLRQSTLLLKAQVSMCIVSKRGIAFSLPFEIFIYIPILPHQQYNLLFHSCRFSLLTFLFFSPSYLSLLPFLPPFVLLSSSFCPPVLFISPFFYLLYTLLLSGRPHSTLVSSFFSIMVFHLCSLSSFQMQPDFCFLLATVYDCMACPVFFRFQHLQEMSREL